MWGSKIIDTKRNEAKTGCEFKMNVVNVQNTEEEEGKKKREAADGGKKTEGGIIFS